MNMSDRARTAAAGTASASTRKRLFNCRGCGAKGDVVALVMHGLGVSFAEAIADLVGELGRPPAPPRPSTSPPTHNGSAEAQHRKAAWLWSQRQPIGGTIAELYLREARGITCALPATLGFLAPHKPEHHSALIAAFAPAEEPEPGILAPPRAIAAVHLTLLKPDGSGKADVEKPKLMVGSPGTAPIVLTPVNDLGGLAIAEGIEDALAVHQATGLGGWAAACAGRLPAMAAIVPPYVESVTVMVDDDPAGRRGAEALARSLVDRVLEVRLADIAQLRGAP